MGTPAFLPLLRTVFTETFHTAPQGIACAPGRVNLIGEHTDYNDGFVFPLAIDRYTALAFAPRPDAQLRVIACDFNEEKTLSLNDLSTKKNTGWSGYVAGVAWGLQNAGYTLPGANLALQGDIPIGAGLSSSAALEMALTRAFCAMADIPWDAAAMAHLSQRAERDYVGVPSGIMDQWAVGFGQAGRALLLDCRSLDTEVIPVPETAGLVVMDTGVRRALAEGAYAERVAACQRVVAHIQRDHPEVRALRDVSPAMLADYRSTLNPTDFQRAQHVVAEIQRPIHMAEALRTSDLPQAGLLMNASHASLRDLYAVSCPELDAMVTLAQAHPACFGARLTGAGFGGCALALVQTDKTDDFIAEVWPAYRAQFDHPAQLYTVQPSDGVHLVSI